MEIKYLKLIKTIAEEGSMSHSAERLFLTQSALSHQLKDLEERLGFKIFHRSRNQWRLTEEGEELYRLAVKVLSEIDNGLHKIREIKLGSRGNIRISTECYSFYHGLPQFVQKMGMLYPDITVELVVEATHQPLAKLLTNELDLAIVTLKAEDDRLIYLELFEDEVFAIMHQEHPLAGKAWLEAEDLAAVHLFIHSFPLETVSVYEHFLKKKGIAPARITAVPLTEVTIELVSANMGITCMPKWALASLKLPGVLVFKKLGKTGMLRRHYAAIRAEDGTKKYLQDFIRNLEEAFAVSAPEAFAASANESFVAPGAKG